MSTILYMVADDTSPDRIFTITRAGATVDLTDATSIKLILSDTASGLITNAGHQTCTISIPKTLGKATYAFQAGDVASNNVHFGDLQISWSTGQIETDYDRIVIYARGKAGTVS